GRFARVTVPTSRTCRSSGSEFPGVTRAGKRKGRSRKGSALFLSARTAQPAHSAFLAGSYAIEAGLRGIPSEMPVGIAEQRLQHADALEVEADVLFVGDRDAAEQLHRIFLHEPAALLKLHLCRRDGRLAPVLVRRIGMNRGEDHHAAAELDFGEHVGRAMLQSLERSDRFAELLSLLQ